MLGRVQCRRVQCSVGYNVGGYNAGGYKVDVIFMKDLDSLPQPKIANKTAFWFFCDRRTDGQGHFQFVDLPV